MCRAWGLEDSSRHREQKSITRACQLNRAVISTQVATLAAAFLATKYPQRKVRLVTFGAPRVGCEDFKEYVEGMPNLRLSRVVENGAGIKLNLSTPRRSTA